MVRVHLNTDKHRDIYGYEGWALSLRAGFWKARTVGVPAPGGEGFNQGSSPEALPGPSAVPGQAGLLTEEEFGGSMSSFPKMSREQPAVGAHGRGESWGSAQAW